MKAKTMYRGSAQDGSSYSSSGVFLPQAYASILTPHSSPGGTVTPSQIFVAGFGYKARERDLQQFFSQYGRVTEVRLAVDQYGLSKGYGFITFVTEEEARNVLVYADDLYFRDQKLSIGQAIYGQAPQPSDRFHVAHYNPPVAPPVSHEPVGQTTNTSFFFTYYNGEAYYFTPSLNPPDHRLVSPITAPPAEMPLQPYWGGNQQSAYHYSQPPAPPNPSTFPQQPEYFNRSDGGAVMPPLHVPAENLTFPHSLAYLNPKYHRDVRYSAYHYP